MDMKKIQKCVCYMIDVTLLSDTANESQKQELAGCLHTLVIPSMAKRMLENYWGRLQCDQYMTKSIYRTGSQSTIFH